jgi:hypothetical protein
MKVDIMANFLHGLVMVKGGKVTTKVKGKVFINKMVVVETMKYPQIGRNTPLLEVMVIIHDKFMVLFSSRLTMNGWMVH